MKPYSIGKILQATLVSISLWLALPGAAHAQLNIIATVCDAGNGFLANYWRNSCYMLIDEQETPDAADGLRMFFVQNGSPYIGGVPQGFQSSSGWFTGDLAPTASPYTPGWWVHSGFVDGGGTAIKYNDIPTNSIGITYQTMCAIGNFWAKPVGGSYVYYPEFDSTTCIPSPITTE